MAYCADVDSGLADTIDAQNLVDLVVVERAYGAATEAQRPGSKVQVLGNVPYLQVDVAPRSTMVLCFGPSWDCRPDKGSRGFRYNVLAEGCSCEMLANVSCIDLSEHMVSRSIVVQTAVKTFDTISRHVCLDGIERAC